MGGSEGGGSNFINYEKAQPGRDKSEDCKSGVYPE